MCVYALKDLYFYKSMAQFGLKCFKYGILKEMTKQKICKIVDFLEVLKIKIEGSHVKLTQLTCLNQRLVLH